MATLLTTAEWDRQFARQANWTRATRLYLYRRANLLRARRVLDVGSGTGTVTEELAAATKGQVIGVDVDPSMVVFSQERKGRADYRLADAHHLPFADGWFDVTACHFTLMWCRDPVRVAREMVRVTRRGGAILICAEPDYGGRIDYPELGIARWQKEALQREGADPCLGRKLRALFAQDETWRVEVGVIPGLWELPTLRAEFESEWALWERSFAGWAPPAELARAKSVEWASIESRERLVFMPVFHALVRP